MKVNGTVKLLESGAARTLMARLYGEDGVEASVKHYEGLLAGYERMFDEGGDMELFSSPGRTKISGNRTDHSHGKVLASSINLDCMGMAGANESSQVHIVSGTRDQDFTIDLNRLEPGKKKVGTMNLVKGPLQGFRDFGHRVGGFNAYITSNVISTTGVSSSTSFGMLLCSIFNTFSNEGRTNIVTHTHVDKLTENNYWDEASGLLDQITCAMGGLITIDFMEPLVPKVEKIDFDFGSQDHSLTIVQTGKDHVSLSMDYSSIPVEMKKVARYFKKGVLSQISERQVIDDLAGVRQFTGDQSVLRALHFFEENKRVEAEVLAPRENRFKDFLNNITASDNSSWRWLRNCFTNNDCRGQGITVTLALTELFIAEKQKGACRIHGGGSTGVITTVLPNELVDEFIHYIEECAGEGGAYRISIRSYGTICFNDLI